MKPTVALFTGDPSGIGPEIVAKVLADPEVHAAARLIIVGSRPVLEEGMRVAGVHTEVPDAAPVPVPGDRPQLLQWEHAGATDFERGVVNAKSGRFMLDGLAAALRAVPGRHRGRDLLRAAQQGGAARGRHEPPGRAALVLRSARLQRPLRRVQRARQALDLARDLARAAHGRERPAHAREASRETIELLTQGLARAGHAQPRIAVCGLNPHNGDDGAYRPRGDRRDRARRRAGALAGLSRPMARSRPTRSSCARQGKGGGYDGVVTMYHDQGQIAMKLLGFERGVTVQGGLPMPITTPAHGTAYDIAGQGTAHDGAMKNALLTAARMGASARSQRPQTA